MAKKYKKIVIGIDQSYKRTGLSICCDGKLKRISSITMDGLENNTEKRVRLHDELLMVIHKTKAKSDDVIIICERIRLRSQEFINEDYLKATGALISVIVDIAYKYDIPVYSVDTRAWKACVVGTSKPKENKYGVDPHKWPTILYLKNSGYLKEILIPYVGRATKGIIEIKGNKYKFNDDAADSACIALFGFLGDSERLKLEH